MIGSSTFRSTLPMRGLLTSTSPFLRFTGAMNEETSVRHMQRSRNAWTILRCFSPKHQWSSPARLRTLELACVVRHRCWIGSLLRWSWGLWRSRKRRIKWRKRRGWWMRAYHAWISSNATYRNSRGVWRIMKIRWDQVWLSCNLSVNP